TTRGARWRRCVARPARSTSTVRPRRSPRRCAPACRGPSPARRSCRPPPPGTAVTKSTRTEAGAGRPRTRWYSPRAVSAADAVPKPPLVLLTGFLGAGKTTLLNRVLGAQHRRRVGVIINELGRIDIDTRLVKSRAGDVLELAGGCVCHEVRVQSELWAAIHEVNRRSHPDVVVLETTGIAEPWSILSGLEDLGDTAPAVAAGVVCVVDAEAGAGQ